MKWADFLTKVKDANGKVTDKGDFTVIEFMVEGQRKHITLQTQENDTPMENLEVTRILNHFMINEMLFRDHY